jgi:Electron transfer DM13
MQKFWRGLAIFFLGGILGTVCGGSRAFKGNQRYGIPAGVDLNNYPSVVNWCERFSVLISPADLTSAR